ncbi:hypothetical protein Dimus_020329 [Dionaea muscipula]
MECVTPTKIGELLALLSGCSAGGLASILHCDEFRNLFPRSTKVKCLADARIFLDAWPRPKEIFPRCSQLSDLFQDCRRATSRKEREAARRQCIERRFDNFKIP